MKKNDSHINYVVNEEKRTCTAYLEGVRDGMWAMVAKRLERAGLRANIILPHSCDGKSFLKAVIDDVPDKVVVTVRCSPEDEFNPETGCALARARLLKKMYDYRHDVAARACIRLNFLLNIFYNLAVDCDERAVNYENEEDAIIYSLKKSN